MRITSTIYATEQPVEKLGSSFPGHENGSFPKTHALFLPLDTTLGCAPATAQMVMVNLKWSCISDQMAKTQPAE
jgi:hypothetical protein